MSVKVMARGLCVLLVLVMADARGAPRPDWLTADLLKSLFPGAVNAGPLEGDPPAAAVYGPGTRLGYVFVTTDVVDTVGFSGAPFVIAVGLDMDGTLTGVRLVDHAEPILDYKNATAVLEGFLAQYLRLDYMGAVRMAVGGQPGEIDGISTATISARSFHHAIVQSARRVARSRGLRAGDGARASVDVLRYEPLRWSELVESGAVQRLEVRVAVPGRSRSVPPHVESTALHLALLTPASVGRNLLSRSVYRDFVATQDPRDLVIGLMSVGSFSFVGTRVFETGTFDRVSIVQEERRHPLVRRLGRYRYLPFVTTEGAPEFSEIGIFRLPADSGIDVLAPWDLVVEVPGDEGGMSRASAHRLTYRLPERFVLPPSEPRDSPVERSPLAAAWEAEAVDVAILVAALVLLSLVLAWMPSLTRRPRLFRFARTGFLLFTLVWLGWIAGAQLSIVNPIGWSQALASGAGLVMLVNDPLLSVLTVFVLGSFVFWGRGVFCGWLCPFGALQELLGGAARLMRVPRVMLSPRALRTLRPVKYVVLGVLVVAAFDGAASLAPVTEVEPFKTAISLRFDRAWPFVAYAIALLVVGMLVERAFCRFLCPLGAVMVIGGKLRARNPLERRDECGSPCQLCRRRCPVQAIDHSGRIDMDECFYCLDCQVIYHDAWQCPPLVNRRKRWGRKDSPGPRVKSAS